MANTNYLKEIECWVRDNQLPRKFPSYQFNKRFLELITGGRHEFDAVSKDVSIVAGIKTHSWTTRGGNKPAGKKANLYQELYFLNLVEAKKKYLVLTNEDTYDNFKHESDGKIANGIEIVFCQLPPDMRRKVADVQKKASEEQKNEIYSHD